MKNLITLIMIAFVWFSSTTFAMSQSNDAKDKKAQDAFKTLLKQTDKNNDGKISKDEYLVIWKDKKVGEAKFKALDTDGNGLITEDEYMKNTVDMHAMNHMDKKEKK